MEPVEDKYLLVITIWAPNGHLVEIYARHRSIPLMKKFQFTIRKPPDPLSKWFFFGRLVNSSWPLL